MVEAENIGVEVWMDGRMEWCSADGVEAKERRRRLWKCGWMGELNVGC